MRAVLGRELATDHLAGRGHDEHDEPLGWQLGDVERVHRQYAGQEQLQLGLAPNPLRDILQHSSG